VDCQGNYSLLAASAMEVIATQPANLCGSFLTGVRGGQRGIFRFFALATLDGTCEICTLGVRRTYIEK